MNIDPAYLEFFESINDTVENFSVISNLMLFLPCLHLCVVHFCYTDWQVFYDETLMLQMHLFIVCTSVTSYFPLS